MSAEQLELKLECYGVCKCQTIVQVFPPLKKGDYKTYVQPHLRTDRQGECGHGRRYTSFSLPRAVGLLQPAV